MSDAQSQQSQQIWPKFRRLLVFQVKLYVDAFRDLFMSPISVIAFVLDLIQGKSGADSNFEGALRFGRRTERAINLFNQYDADKHEAYNVDTAISQIEESLSRHYKDGTLSEKTRQILENTIRNLRGNRPADDTGEEKKPD